MLDFAAVSEVSLFLFLLLPYAKSYHKPQRVFLLLTVLFSAAFAVLMAVLYRNNAASIGVTVAYIGAMLTLNVIIGVRASKNRPPSQTTEKASS